MVFQHDEAAQVKLLLTTLCFTLALASVTAASAQPSSALRTHGKQVMDPRRSVTNQFGQTHDIKNLYVVDNSVFPSGSNYNPVWTILAVSWRASEDIVARFKRREL